MDALPAGCAGRCLEQAALLPACLPGHQRDSGVSGWSCTQPEIQELPEEMIYHSLTSLLLPSCLFATTPLCRHVCFIAVTVEVYRGGISFHVIFFFFFLLKKFKGISGVMNPVTCFLCDQSLDN